MNDNDINNEKGLYFNDKNDEQYRSKDVTVEASNINPNMFNDNKQSNMEPTVEVNPFERKDNLASQLNGLQSQQQPGATHNYQINYYGDNSQKQENNVDLAVEENQDLLDNLTQEKPIKDKTVSIARKNLRRAIFWTVIFILTIIFGAKAINDFINALSNFIDSASHREFPDTSYGADYWSEGWKITGQFFYAFALIFEAFMFAFFILLSLTKMFKNYRPWYVYRQSTEHKRYRTRIIEKKLEVHQLLKKLTESGRNVGLKFVEINEEDDFLPIVKGEPIRAKAYFNLLNKEIKRLEGEAKRTVAAKARVEEKIKPENQDNN